MKTGRCVIAILLFFFGLTQGALGAEIATKPTDWKVGFWLWQRWGVNKQEIAPREELPIDLLYVHAGGYSRHRPTWAPPSEKAPEVSLTWPEYLPKASAYIAVLRCEALDADIIPALVTSYRSIQKSASKRNQKIAGLQIDYDCPRLMLDAYALFLGRLRSALGQDELLSVTALLDWFLSGTDVADMVRQVDEFIPQFYDTNAWIEEKIAEPIDPAKWGPVFNGYNKPYKIGIASFGRMIKAGRTPESPKSWEILGDSPVRMIAREKGRFIRQAINAAGEMIAVYQPEKKSSESASVKLILPTDRSVSDAYNAAKQMGGNCSGVVFFRYSSGDEAFALSGSEVNRIITGTELETDQDRVEAEDGYCTTVTCCDLSIRLKDRFPEKPRMFILKASNPIDIFLPDQFVPSRLVNSRALEITIPAFAGAPEIPVGRVMSKEPVRFVLEEKK